MATAEVYNELADKMRASQSRIPEILSKLATPEECQMMLALPASPKELAEKFQMDEDAARRKLDEFVTKGMVFAFVKEGQLRYFFARSVGQISDSISAAVFNHPDWPIREEVLELWERNREDGVKRAKEFAGKAMPPAKPGTRFRVIPLRAAVKDNTGMLAYEDTEAILRNAPAIAVVNCPCRMYQVEHGLNDKPLEVCMQLTAGSAKYAEDQGIGRTLTMEEGLAILRITEEAGLVPSVFGGEKLGFICHCDGQGCSSLRVGAETGLFGYEKSRYQSTVDPSLCNGCQTCVERCIFGAIEMVKVADSRKLKAVVDLEKCYGCGACVITCPVEGAITLKLGRPKEHIPLMEGAQLQV